MRLLNWLRNRYALFCPHCRNELNWFDTSIGKGNQTDHLKCVTCERFFINDAALTTTDVPRRRVEYYKQQGFDDEGYQGVPTSYFYKPEWLRKIERFLRLMSN